MTEKPRVGDTVCLSEEGYGTVHLRSADAYERAKRMVITYVSAQSLTEPEQTWQIRVNHPEVDQYLLTNWDVEPITAAS